MLPQPKGNDGLRKLMAEAAYNPLSALATACDQAAPVVAVAPAPYTGRRAEQKRAKQHVKACQRLLSDAYGGKKRANRRPRARSA